MTKVRVQLPSEIEKFDFQSKLGYMALKAFFRISEEWNCTLDEQSKLLGGVGLIKLEEYRALPAAELDRKMLIRIRCFVMIYRATVAMHGSISKANREIRIARTGLPFKGRSPIRHIYAGGLMALMETCKFYSGELPRQATDQDTAA